MFNFIFILICLLKQISDGTLAATLFGAGVGGSIRMTETYFNFIRNNQATRYDNPHMARRVLYDRVSVW